MPRGWDTCPVCGGPKTVRARKCRTCGGLPPMPMLDHDAHRTIDYERQVDPAWRPAHLPPVCPTCRGFGYVQGLEGETNGEVDYRRKVTSRSSPDAKPARRRVTAGRALREGRLTRAGGWHECPACLDHPGNLMTHADWTSRRPA